MQAREIRAMTDEEIRDKLEDIKEEQFNLRFQWVSGTLEDYTRLRDLKRDVARLKTILRERELAAEMEDVRDE